MTKEIGGFFELELNLTREFHPQAIRLNTGRNCLEYVLRSGNYRILHIPLYSCDTILEPLKKLRVEFDYYRINPDFEIAQEMQLKEGEAILYINYFGLKDSYLPLLAREYGKRLIVDNSQAFYSKPLEGIDTFYSPRKFFGVADGGYLYVNRKLKDEWEVDGSAGRMDHLLVRIENGAEKAYHNFMANEQTLSNQPLRRMSKLTRRLLQSVDYSTVKLRREGNFIYLHSHLKKYNQLNVSTKSLNGPMIYPLLLDRDGLKEKLIQNRIYVATYWPEVETAADNETLEARLAKKLIALPVDQRYDDSDMDKVVRKIESILKKII